MAQLMRGKRIGAEQWPDEMVEKFALGFDIVTRDQIEASITDEFEASFFAGRAAVHQPCRSLYIRCSARRPRNARPVQPRLDLPDQALSAAHPAGFDGT